MEYPLSFITIAQFSKTTSMKRPSILKTRLRFIFAYLLFSTSIFLTLAFLSCLVMEYVHDIINPFRPTNRTGQ